LTENLLLSDAQDLPVAIVRPAMGEFEIGSFNESKIGFLQFFLVGASMTEPSVGYVDNMAVCPDLRLPKIQK
jgi:hypothetical protein